MTLQTDKNRRVMFRRIQYCPAGLSFVGGRGAVEAVPTGGEWSSCERLLDGGRVFVLFASH